MFTLQDLTVLIVGGSSGIGLATAQAAQRLGAHVLITALSPTEGEAASAALNQAPWAELDFTSAEATKTVVAKLAQAHGPLHHVYVAAGTTALTHIANDPLESQIALLRMRVEGSVNVVRAALPWLDSRGSVTLTGGISTDRPVKGAWVSGVGTASAEQLARVLALELAPIRFNAVSPGWTDTPLWDRILGANKASVLDGVAASLPVGHIASPDDIAMAVILLMCNPSITGEIVHVDGGGRLI